MREWIACAVLAAVCARIAWVNRADRRTVETCALVALCGVALVALR